MAIYNLRRFSNLDSLKAIGREHLLALLAPHGEYLAGRGVVLPPQESDEVVDYEGLAGVLLNPNMDTPRDLADAFYLVHEMATPEGMNELIEETARRGVVIENGSEATPADIAAQVWLGCREVIESKHAEHHLLRRRAFEYFQTDRTPVPAFFEPTSETIKELEDDLDCWFEGRYRGRGCKVMNSVRANEIWFFVRHGDPFKRDGCIEDGRSSSVFYRPEKHDLIIYNPAVGEVRINARTRGEKDLYRRMFGKHIFGSEEFFPGDGKYCLDPLQCDGELSLVCTDVDGMDWTKLKEIHYLWNGPVPEIEIRKAEDIFAVLNSRGRVIPPQPRIVKASFQVKFTDSRTPRIVTIRPSNIAQYVRDDDSVIIEDWLNRRGFIGQEGEHRRVNAPALVAIS